MFDEHIKQNKFPMKEQNKFKASHLLHTYKQKAIKQIGIQNFNNKAK